MLLLRTDVPPSIEWKCTSCDDDGVISGWERSPFDLRPRADEDQADSGIDVLELVIDPEVAATLRTLLLIDTAAERLVYRAEATEQGIVLAGDEDAFEELIESVAAEANHEQERRRQKRLDAAFDALSQASGRWWWTAADGPDARSEASDRWHAGTPGWQHRCMAEGTLWNRMNSQQRRAADKLSSRDIPTSPGVYAWYRDGNPVYSGRAIGKTGLHERVWGSHLRQGNDLSRSSFRRNVCEHLGTAPTSQTRMRPTLMTVADVEPVNRWIRGCEVAWIEFDSATEAKAVERALHTEWMPPLSRR